MDAADSSLARLTPLRNPKAAAIRSIFSVSAPNDAEALVDYELDLAYLLMSLAGKKADRNQKYGMNGFMQSAFPDREKAINDLRVRDYLAVSAPRDALDKLTVPVLKAFLLQFCATAPRSKGSIINANQG